MSRSVEPRAAGPGFLAFLADELAPSPGRLAAVARMAANCTLVVILGMIYQIPLVAYMAYLVFLISKTEAASTLVTGLAGIIAVTLAVGLSLVMYRLDASEPALRLPLMALATFCGMYFSRVSRLGPIAFLGSFVLVMSQTQVDRAPNLEVLVRGVLWLWVVAALPVFITVLVECLIGENPARLARRRAILLLRGLAAALREGVPASPRLQEQALALLQLRERAQLFDRTLKTKAAADRRLIGILAELLALQRLLPPDLPVAARAPLADALDAHVIALETGRAQEPVSLVDASQVPAWDPRARPVIRAMATAVERLGHGIAARAAPAGEPPVQEARSLLVADALTNPDHARYALKTTLAVMAAYIIYTAVAWPEISTAITTCFFVALGSFGETMRKLTLRLSGAVIGGIAGALCIVYIMPALTDIGQLSLLIAAASGLAAWIATSSERLAYAGMQIAFAFFLGVLQGYGPTTELTVLRDRVLGIMLGNLLMTLAFTTLWPASALVQARAALAGALRQLGGLLAGEAGSQPGDRLGALRALAEARRLLDIAGFELGLMAGPANRRATDTEVLEGLDRLAAATLATLEQPGEGEFRQQDRAAAAWLVAYADGLAQGAPPPSAPSPAFVPSRNAPKWRAAVEARALLLKEIEHATLLHS